MRLSNVNITSTSGSSQTSTTGDAETSARSSVATMPAPDRHLPWSAPPGPPVPEATDDAADFQSVRPRLFGIAYRMLGRVADAEDIVQDVWIRWQRADRARVQDRIAFLVKITTRLALNVAVSARARREISVDHWLPERVLAPDDPTRAAEQSEDLQHAVLLLHQRLSPTERAVFVLREAFDYPFREIAEALEISEANARQLGRRARTHLTEPRHEPVQRAACDRLQRAFLDAAQVGAVARLERILAADVLSHSRSGRNTSARNSPRAAAPGTAVA